MDNSLIDLDILFPESKPIKLKGYADGIEYSVSMFVSVDVGLIATKILKDDSLGLAESNLKILETFLIRQYEHMNRDWIIDNISMAKQNFICEKILEEATKKAPIEPDVDGGAKKK